MQPKPETPKAGDPCPYCGEGKLVVSASGWHLVCKKCGRVVLIKRSSPQKP